jgi:hypothetical protein
MKGNKIDGSRNSVSEVKDACEFLVSNPQDETIVRHRCRFKTL